MAARGFDDEASKALVMAQGTLAAAGAQPARRENVTLTFKPGDLGFTLGKTSWGSTACWIEVAPGGQAAGLAVQPHWTILEVAGEAVRMNSIEDELAAAQTAGEPFALLFNTYDATKSAELQGAVEDDDGDGVRRAVSEGADPHWKADGDGAVMLVYACKLKKWGAVLALLEAGADPARTDCITWNALHHTCFHGGVAVVKAFMNHPSFKAVLAAEDRDGSTPLVVALEEAAKGTAGCKEVVQLLQQGLKPGEGHYENRKRAEEDKIAGVDLEKFVPPEDIGDPNYTRVKLMYDRQNRAMATLLEKLAAMEEKITDMKMVGGKSG